MKRVLATLLLATAAGCASPPPPPRPQPVVYRAPPPVYTPIPQPNRDQCGAGALQTLIGRPRTEIPVPVDPGRRRVACTTCPVTQDFRPDRLNILFDPDSGLVREVRCG